MCLAEMRKAPKNLSSEKVFLQIFEPGTSLTQVEVLQLAATCSDPSSYTKVSSVCRAVCHMPFLVPVHVLIWEQKILKIQKHVLSVVKYFDGL